MGLVNKALESCKSKIFEKNPKTPTTSPSLHSPFLYETPLTELNKDTVKDNYHSQEEEVDLFNIEVIAMKSLMEDQMLIPRQSRKIQPCIINL